MGFIGKTPTSGDFVLLDSITTSATASYTMQKNSVNFEPQSANHMIVSLNGTIQAPVSSFTVSGSTLTFASALTSSDVIDFILVLGNVNDVGTATTVVDSAITRGKLNLISDGSNPSLIAKGDGSSVEGKIQFNCENNSHGQTIQASPHSAGQSWTLKLPDNSPTADKFLKVKSITGSGATATGQLEFAEAGGGLVYVGGTSSTSQVSALTVDSVFSSTYQNYLVVYGTTVNSGSNNTRLQMRVRSGGSTQTGSSYHTIYDFMDTTTSSGNHNVSSTNSNNATRITVSGDALSNSGNLITTVGTLYCFDMYKNDEHKLFLNNNANLSWGAYLQGSTTSVGYYLDDTLIDGLTFFGSNGDLKRGYIRVYGIVDS